MPTELLCKSELLSAGIISRPDGETPRGFRGTTYDTCVGEIITKHGIFEGNTYFLPPRGIVWLLSEEDYKLPDNITGITTLRTTWTKQGILTLTVGIVDPNYEGPLSTALINFSANDFPIKRGDAFFRTAFLRHDPSNTKSYVISRDEYRAKLIQDSTKFSTSFLTVDTLAAELTPKILGLPRLGLWIGVIALGVSFFTLVTPPAWDFLTDRNGRIEVLEERIEDLERLQTNESSKN